MALFDDLDDFLGEIRIEQQQEAAANSIGNESQNDAARSSQIDADSARKSRQTSENWCFDGQQNFDPQILDGVNVLMNESMNVQEKHKIIDDNSSDKELNYSDDEANLIEAEDETNSKKDANCESAKISAPPTVTVINTSTPAVNLSADSWSSVQKDAKKSQDFQKLAVERMKKIEMDKTKQTATPGEYKVKSYNLFSGSSNQDKIVDGRGNTIESFPTLEEDKSTVEINPKADGLADANSGAPKGSAEHPASYSSRFSANKYTLNVPPQTSSAVEASKSSTPVVEQPNVQVGYIPKRQYNIASNEPTNSPIAVITDDPGKKEPSGQYVPKKRNYTF
ncbi:MAG: hypothetical protein MHMPM18_001953 [Marteilia pararefringens]